MNDLDQRLDEWARRRRERPSAQPGFSAAVMQEITGSLGPEQPAVEPSRTIRSPLLALLCLFAGFGKLALVLHLAF